MSMSTVTYNKKLVPSDHPCISYNDRGFTLGHGFFETILVKKGALPALDYHWRRLEASAPIIGIQLPFSRTELEVMINQLITENNLQNKIAGTRVTITHGESERGLLPLQTPAPNFLISVFECAPSSDRPFSALIVNTRKNEHSASSRIKSISYLDNILAKREAMEQNFDEAIMLNTASNIADGSISNVYMVKDGQIFTPLVSDGALPGVIRSILLEEFNEDLKIIEKSVTVSELLAADEIFLTNALMGIKAIGTINNKELISFSTSKEIRVMLQNLKNYV